MRNCSLVICYDVPTRPLSLVQTVGRVRARDAEVVFMEEAPSRGATRTVRRPLLARFQCSGNCSPPPFPARRGSKPAPLWCCCASCCAHR